MSTTASYILHGRGRSHNAEIAEGNGRFPASRIAKAIGRGVTAAFIKEHAPHSGEWHHVGKYAAAIEYYDLETITAWLDSLEGQAALNMFKAARAAAKVTGPRVITADVVIAEWSRVAINRFGKLAWRSTTKHLSGVAVTEIGSDYYEIAGYGRKARKHVSLTEVSVEEIRRRANRARSLKAAKTRREKIATSEFRAAMAAAISRPVVLALPRFALAASIAGDDDNAVLRRFAKRWATEGRAAVHPAPAAVMAAKARLNLTWSQIQRLA